MHPNRRPLLLSHVKAVITGTPRGQHEISHQQRPPPTRCLRNRVCEIMIKVRPRDRSATFCNSHCRTRHGAMTITLGTQSQRSLRIGVDCGGTNTDAVILDLTTGAPEVVLAATKAPTTPEVTHGIQSAITTVLSSQPDVQAQAIQAVSIGTTHFVNALISRSTDRLARVAVIRLCGPFSRATPPFAGFPYELREILEGPTFMVEGGLQIDGSEISQVSPAPRDDVGFRSSPVLYRYKNRRSNRSAKR